MTTIKAAVVRERGGPFLTEEIQIDSPNEYEVLINVKASGLCHSDLHFANDDYGYDLPSIFGHEAAGIVEKIGERVTEFAVGDHVVACLIQYCNHCDMCLSNVHHLCMNGAYTERENSDHSRLIDHAGERLNQAYGVGGFCFENIGS